MIELERKLHNTERNKCKRNSQAIKVRLNTGLKKGYGCRQSC